MPLIETQSVTRVRAEVITRLKESRNSLLSHFMLNYCWFPADDTDNALCSIKYRESFNYIYKLYRIFAPELLYLKGYMERARILHHAGTWCYIYMCNIKSKGQRQERTGPWLFTSEGDGVDLIQEYNSPHLKSVKSVVNRWETWQHGKGHCSDKHILYNTAFLLSPAWLCTSKRLEANHKIDWWVILPSPYLHLRLFSPAYLGACNHLEHPTEQHASIYLIKGKMCLRQTLEIQHNLANFKDSCLSNGLWRRPW